MIDPDMISIRICTALTSDCAERMLADRELLDECALNGVDLCELVRNLSRRVPERVKATDSVIIRRNIVRLLQELTRRRIQFVLIGGLAARIYGCSHTTTDLDICHSRNPENLERLAEMLRDLGATFRRMPVHVPPALEAATLATETDFVFDTPYGHFDLIGEFTGVGAYAEACEGAIAVNLVRKPLRILSLPKLIAAKKSTGRPKDVLVHKELEIIKKLCEKIDAALVI